MMNQSEPVVFPTSSVDLRLSKPSCACVWGLFFGSYCVWRAFYHGGQRFLPVFLRVLQEPLYYIDVMGFLEHPEKDWEVAVEETISSTPVTE